MSENYKSLFAIQAILCTCMCSIGMPNIMTGVFGSTPIIYYLCYHASNYFIAWLVDWLYLKLITSEFESSCCQIFNSVDGVGYSSNDHTKEIPSEISKLCAIIPIQKQNRA